jgi:hypothetical protein
VRVAGVEVGTVTAIQFADAQVDVTFELRDTVGSGLPTNRCVARFGVAARRECGGHHTDDRRDAGA